MTNVISVNHNMEIAHRLSNLPGKCQQIHGHSMQVRLDIYELELNENGIAGGIDFGSLKKEFRDYIDHHYDHRLHLNANDPFAQPMYFIDELTEAKLRGDVKRQFLPGLVTHKADPTVENLAKWIATDMADVVAQMADQRFKLFVYIEETMTNGAGWQITHEG